MTSFENSSDRDQPRDAAGRYASYGNTEPDGLDLGAPVEAGPAGSGEDRGAQLAERGYSSALPGMFDDTRRADQWWEDARARHGTFGGGHQMIGSSRIDQPVRRTYTSGTAQVRMPSFSACHRQADRDGGRTFEMPVEVQVTLPDGRLAACETVARVTRHSPHSWSVDLLGVPQSEASDACSEAVTAVLESRRPTQSLRHLGDITEAHRARVKAAGVKPRRLRSTWIDSMSRVDDVMVMVTKRGDVYGNKTSQEVYEQIVNASSPGAAYNAMKRARGERVSMGQCRTCGNVYYAATGHKCKMHDPPTPAESRQRTEHASSVRLAARVLSGIADQPRSSAT